jgi:alginate O-acetyltransferase complex protein AlgI
MSMGDAWLGLIAYTIQIYFDFSGYSDMAIGLGLMFGFRFPENFRRPYSAVSITDFWRRWHITLSNWFRDYVYIPLGGSHRGTFRTYANLITVFLLTGLWHGANWTFILWGAYHGLLMLVERATGVRPVGDAPLRFEWVRRGLVLLAVMGGWVMFRAPSVKAAFAYFEVLLGGSVAGLQVLDPAMTTRAIAGLLVGAASFLLPRTFVMGPTLADLTNTGRWVGVARWAAVAPGLAYSAIVIAGGSFSPFLYFQF